MTFTPTTIYKDLMKKVHPDLHPTMTNATARAQQVNAVKNDANALMFLAIAWGYVQAPARPIPHATYTRPVNARPTYTRPAQPDFSRTYMPKTLWDLLLFSNRGYANQDVYVRICIRRRHYTCKVIRTTLKCVVVDFYGTLKVVKMANVVRREQAMGV